MPNKVITVANIEQQRRTTRFGEKTVFKVVGTDGWKIDFAFKNPSSVGVSIGGTYDIQYNTGSYGDEWIKGSAVVPAVPGGGLISFGSGGATSGVLVASKPSPAAFTPTPAPYPPIPVPEAPALQFPVPSSSHRTVDIRTAALTAAVRFWENRPMPSEITAEEQAEYAIKTAYTFAEFISGQREVSALADMGKDQLMAEEEAA